MNHHARVPQPFIEQDDHGNPRLVAPPIMLDSPIRTELPLTVRDAARFLGVSRQTVYLWVERKQIPHLRVMGRNIRFLKSDLEPFRAHSNRRWEWQDLRNMMVSYIKRNDGKIWWMRYRDRSGSAPPGINWYRRLGGSAASLRERLQARDDKHAGDRPQRRTTYLSGLGGLFSWRTTPSRRSGQRRRTKPMGGR